MRQAAKLGVKTLELSNVKIEFDTIGEKTQNRSTITDKSNHFDPVTFEIDEGKLSKEERELLMISNSEQWEKELLYNETEEKTHILPTAQAF